MGLELRPSSTANSHFWKTKVSGDGIIGGGVRAGPFLCLLRADRGDMLSGWTQLQSSSLSGPDAVGIRDWFQLLEPPRQP